MKSTAIPLVGLLLSLLEPAFADESDSMLLEQLKPALDRDLRSAYLETDQGRQATSDSAQRIEEIRKTCRVIRIQLDPDDDEEIVVWVGYLSGKNNSIMFVYDRKDGRWRSLGRILGSHPVAVASTASTSQGLMDVETWWHAGSGEGVVTTYKFNGQEYVKVASEKRMLEGH